MMQTRGQWREWGDRIGHTLKINQLQCVCSVGEPIINRQSYFHVAAICDRATEREAANETGAGYSRIVNQESVRCWLLPRELMGRDCGPAIRPRET